MTLLPVSLLAAEPTNALTRSLSLQECIRLGVAHNFDVKIEEKSVDVARHHLQEAYAGYEPVWLSTAERKHNFSPAGLDADGQPFVATKADTDTIASSIAGILPTGLSYELGGEVMDTHGAGPDADDASLRAPFDDTRGSAAIKLRQPLLRNAWVNLPRLTIQVTKKELRFSELGWRARLMEIVTRVEAGFYDLLLARESVKVQEEALRLAEELLASNRERIRLGVMAALDEKQAESQVSAQRSLVLAARRSVSLQENVLKNLVSDNLAEWQDVSIQPVGELTAVMQPVRRDQSWERGLSMRPDLLQARTELERLGYITGYRRNQTLPQLDVVGSYGHGAHSTEFSGALEQVREGSSPFHSYGLVLSVPLTGRSTRESYRAAKAEREQSGLRLRQLEQEIMLQIDDAVKTVETNFERVGATRQAREFAEVALQAEQAKFENGKVTSFFVLQLQRDLTTARSEEIRALAEYNKALAQLALREGTVLERHQIDFRF
jgi:outer membrane protein TolC